MSYQSVVEMAASNSLLQRIIAAAATEQIPDPQQWAQINLWHLVSTGDWDDAWDYAKATYNADYNPDTGARPGVINDNMILSAVQALKTAQASG